MFLHLVRPEIGDQKVKEHMSHGKTLVHSMWPWFVLGLMRPLLWE